MDAHQAFNCWFNADERKTNDNVSPSVLPIQLANNTGTQLEHLNEDCLLEIFSSNSLTIMDLCSLAETCTRFKEITQRVFPKCYRIARECFLRKIFEFQLQNGIRLLKDLHDVGRILRSFGTNLSELSIGSEDQDIVSLVGNFCSDVALNQPEILYWESIESVKLNINSILQRLRKLTVTQCHFNKEVALQNLNFASLIQLEITNSSECVAILKQSFPNLKRFIWDSSHVYTRDRNNGNQILYTFIRRHGQLKSIKVRGASVCRSGLLHVIDSTCKELEALEELTLEKVERRDPNFNFSTQGGLSNLKMLKLDFMYDKSYTHHIELLQAAKSLETIKICCDKGMPIPIAEVLSQLPNLREFHWSGSYFNRIPWAMLARLRKVHLFSWYDKFDAVDLLNMISTLVNLEELLFESGRIRTLTILTKDVFSRIVEIVERREHVLTLKGFCSFESDENCNVNQKVKLINSNDESDED